MYPDLSSKTALVTGSGKVAGIGYAVAKKLAASGVNVILTDIAKPEDEENQLISGEREAMEALARDLAGAFEITARFLEMDVTRSESIHAVAETIRRDVGRIDILCNNAGTVLGVPSAVHTYDEAAWMKTIDVNLHGVFRVSSAMVPLMTGGGVIINMASRAAKVPPLFNGAYAVSKAAVVMLTRVMAKELAGSGIRVNAVCPGVIETDFTRWRFELEARILQSTEQERQAEMIRTIPSGRLGRADEVAALVAFLASEESSYMTGQAINVTGGQLMEL